MKRIAKLIIALPLVLGTLMAQDISKVSTTAGQFLKLEVGARGASLGGAYVAGVDDISAIHWNPAGIANFQRPGAYASYLNLYAGIQHGFLGTVYPMSPTDFFGIGLTYLNSGEMEVNTIDFPEGTTEFFSVSNVAISTSYARKMTDRLNIGVTVKYVREQIWREVASTFGFDIGSQFNTGILGTTLGMAITNFSSEMKFDGPDLDVEVDVNPKNQGNVDKEARLYTESWPLPLVFRMGIKTDLVGGSNEMIKSNQNRLTLFIDGNDPLDHELRFNYGLEYEWREMASLRFGYHQNYDTANITGGVGVKFNASGTGLHLDYSVADFGILDLVQQLSLGMEF
jgi:hypothetical protein